MKTVFLSFWILMVAVSCQAQPSMPDKTDTIPKTLSLRVGAEELFSKEYAKYDGSRYAVVGNQSSLVGEVHLVDTLLSCGVNIVKIFCPEHGFRGKAEAGARVGDENDAKTGLPIVSLYGKNKKPTPEQMKDIDAVIFDLQDVGCRFYTYISTLHYVMEACAERGIPCIVLDRPNPNCHYVDGPVLDKKYQSFIGMHPVPIVYGLTIGEYATMINGERWLKDSLQCDLIVVPMQNYRRDSSYVLPVAPSPNLQTPQSILLYPSLCLFEGTNISEGRGTTHPFELIGAPFIDASKLAGSLNAMKLPGIRWRPVHFTPMFSKFANELCHGVQLHITDPIAFRPFEAGLRLFDEIRQNCPELKFYSGHFDHLIGTDTLRLGTESVDHMIERAKAESQAFMEQTKPFRIY